MCKWLEAQAGDDNSVLERNLRSIHQDALLQAVNNLVVVSAYFYETRDFPAFKCFLVFAIPIQVPIQG